MHRIDACTDETRPAGRRLVHKCRNISVAHERLAQDVDAVVAVHGSQVGVLAGEIFYGVDAVEGVVSRCQIEVRGSVVEEIDGVAEHVEAVKVVEDIYADYVFVWVEGGRDGFVVQFVCGGGGDLQGDVVEILPSFCFGRGGGTDVDAGFGGETGGEEAWVIG